MIRLRTPGVVAILIAATACGQRAPRTLDDGGLDDGGLDDDARDPDAGEPSITCELAEESPEIASLPAPAVVDSLGLFAVDVVALGGWEMVDGRPRGAVLMLARERLELLDRLELGDGARSASIRYSPANALLDVSLGTDEGVEFRAYELDYDWEQASWTLDVHVAHALCRECAPGLGAPLPGPTFAAVATADPASSQVRLHVAPYAASEPPTASAALPGERPVVVRGSFGPMLVYWRDGELMTARYHWDGAPSHEPAPVRGGPFTGSFTAADGVGDEVWVAALEGDAPPRLVLLGLDGAGRRIARYELAEVSGPQTPIALSVDEETLLVVWIEQGDAPDQRVIFAAAQRRGGVGAAMAPARVSAPFPARPEPSLAAIPSNGAGHLVVWSAGNGRGGSDLRGREIRCRRR